MPELEKSGMRISIQDHKLGVDAEENDGFEYVQESIVVDSILIYRCNQIKALINNNGALSIVIPKINQN